MPVLPPEIEFGTVTGCFLAVAADSNDADALPEAVAVKGTVTFTPAKTRIATPTATVLQSSLVYALDSDGFLVDGQGNEPQLPAAPVGDEWTWTASFNVTNAKAPDSVSFVLLAGQTIDLRTLVPVDPDTGSADYTLVTVASGVGSVNGQTGAVVLTAADVSADAAGAAAAAQTAAESYTDTQVAAVTPASIGAATAAQGTLADSAVQPGDLPTFGTAASAATTDFASAAQGTLADTAVQPADLATVATTGAYTDLTGQPAIPNSPDDIGAATAAQGTLADSAVQPGDLAAVATSGLASDVGLGNVDNTADVDKPISTATQDALNTKLEALDYSNAAPGTRFTMLYDGSTGFVDPATGTVAAARPSARTVIYFDLIGGSAAVTDPAWMLNGDAREVTS